MKKDTSSTNPQQSSQKIAESIYELVCDNPFDHAKTLRTVCEKPEIKHITFVGVVGEGLISAIVSKVKTIRVFHTLFNMWFVQVGGVSRELGLDFHFYQDYVNQWSKLSEPQYRTDCLVLEYNTLKSLLDGIEKYSKLTNKYLIIHDTWRAEDKIKNAIKKQGHFEESYSESNKGLHIFNKLNS